jgi:hypothetical protein
MSVGAERFSASRMNPIGAIQKPRIGRNPPNPQKMR